MSNEKGSDWISKVKEGGNGDNWTGKDWWQKGFPELKSEKDLLRRMKANRPGDRLGMSNCFYCGKPLKKIEKDSGENYASYKYDCACVEKYPKLKDLRLSVG
jgi:hypothetical protein